MARPRKNNADYFPHDNDMRNDEKVKAARNKFSHTGYAIWCYLLEKLCKADNFRLRYDIDSGIQAELFAGDFDIDVDELRQIIKYYIKIDLLQYSDGYIFSDEMITRFGSVLKKRVRQQRTDKKSGNIVIDVQNPPLDVVIDDDNPINSDYKGVIDDDNPVISELWTTETPKE